MWYRAYLLGPRYSITAMEEFEAESDAAAVNRVDALVVERNGFAGFELWQEARSVVLSPNLKSLRSVWPPRRAAAAGSRPSGG